MNYPPTLAQKVAFLRLPASYGVRSRVRTIETHFAWVFLCGPDAYKLKKPLRHKQMDYRSLPARRRGCREEVRINQRMAPSVYRRVLPLTWAEGQMAIGGRGQIVDWLIEMRRVPETQMLDRSVQSALVSERDIDRVARALRRFYTSALRRPCRADDYLRRLARQIRANEREIARYADHVTQQLASQVRLAQLAAADALKSVLAARAACIVDGHGDLRAEHVCLGSPIEVIDALEFDPRLRRLDPVEEVALLALEIERLGRRDLAERLMERFSGAPPWRVSREVFCFYRSHRAATRAKLAAWHIGDPQFPNARPWIERTDSLLNDALRYANAARGMADVARASRSIPDRRPAMQKRRERRAGGHATYGFGEEAGHMQFR